MKPTLEQLEAFRLALETKNQAEHKIQFARLLTPPEYVLEMGSKYARIVSFRTEQNWETGNPEISGRSAYGFINLENGDLLKAAGWKAAGWKAPAKGARGNMLSATPLKGCERYGMVYNR